MTERPKVLHEAAKAIGDVGSEWYGTDLFPNLPPEFDWALLDRWLSDTFGFRIDRLSAEYYRRACSMAARKLHELADLAAEEDA